MLEDLYTYCESPIETPDVKNKASAYEYLIKRYFESSFDISNDYNLNLFPIIMGINGYFLTPDMELTTFFKNFNIKIIAEIKYIEISSLNKKGARRVTRRKMDEYITAYNEKYPDTFIIPLVITQSSYFNKYPDYPCMVLSSRELKNVNLQEKIKEKIEENLQKISEHSNMQIG